MFCSVSGCHNDYQVLAVEADLAQNRVAEEITPRKIQVIADAGQKLAEDSFRQLRMRALQSTRLLLPNELVDNVVDDVDVGTTDEPQSTSATCGDVE